MCGIAGFFNQPDGYVDRIKCMVEHMHHRGPDQQDYWNNEDKTVVLGHARLSILDLSDAGKQPMVSLNGRYVIVLNGEIYNHIDLRNKLYLDGYDVQFKGHSDTESLLEYIVAYGINRALADAIGMFSFAIYDREEKRLVLARDRIGEKPLYYGFINGKFVFASDIGCFKTAYNNKLEIDRNALYLFFQYGYIPSPDSIYQGIKKLIPGHYAVLSYPFSAEDYQEYVYWDILKIAKAGDENLYEGSFDEAVNHLDNIIHQSVARQMVADVDVGAFLSGGIDSSTVVSIMQDISPRSIKTFTIGFDEEKYDEARYSKEIAKYLGTDHTELYIHSDDMMNIIPQMPRLYGEPFADSSQLPTYMVSKLAKKYVTVSLSGDGGDELFCGYNSYFSMTSTYGKLNKLPYWVRKEVQSALSRLPKTENREYEALKNVLGYKSVEELFYKGGNPEWASSIMGGKGYAEDWCSRYVPGFLTDGIEKNLMLMDMQMYHPDDILVKVDRSGMAVSLETRIPLLDKDIVEFALRLPIRYDKDKNKGKKALREVLYRYVPQELMDRPKKGFSVPIKDWLINSKLKCWAEDMLSPARIKRKNILQAEVVTKSWELFKRGKISEARIWRILMFEEWLNQ